VASWGCSEPPVYGYVIPTADGIASDADGNAQGSDEDIVDDTGTAIQNDVVDQDVAPDAEEPKILLRYAMPDANKDDFGGVCDQLCKLQSNQNGIRKLYVQVTSGGVGVANVPVRFQLADPAAAIGLGEVLLETTLTDENGVAMTEVKSGNQVGVYDVVASVAEVSPTPSSIGASASIAASLRGMPEGMIPPSYFAKGNYYALTCVCLLRTSLASARARQAE